MTLAAIDREARDAGLMVMGALHDDGDTLILLGAAAGFWRCLTAAAEGQDGAPDPVDRYSFRVITAIAKRAGGAAHFPFGGPPYEPFIDWAKRSGRAWPSPTGMLVHDTAGLMISYRGAVRLSGLHPLDRETGQSPCLTCAGRACETTCPVGALSGTGPYNVIDCHAYLDTKPGRECLSDGCAVCRACPVSQRFARDPAQSAHHMRAFHPT